MQNTVISVDEIIARLSSCLRRYSRLAIAVSGGVDSMTLASVAATVLKNDVLMVHAVSPAVPVEATERVKTYAKKFNWPLRIVDAGEFDDERYRQNPVNRCYYCKSNLYQRLAEVWDGTIASGANLDDLGDYRPGLLAAQEKQVVHPLIEADIDKSLVRAIANAMQLTDVADLPAQPCLSSRVETGIAINASDLLFVHRMETWLTDLLGAGDHRCRITAEGVRIEVSPEWQGKVNEPASSSSLYQVIEQRVSAEGRSLIAVAAYQRGSAFIHPPSDDLVKGELSGLRFSRH